MGHTIRVTETASNAGGQSAPASSTATAVVVVPPPVTLTAPVAGSFTNSSRPTFAGAAGIASGDLSTVKVAVYFGSSVSGTAVQMLSASASGGRWSIAATTALTGGTYTVQASQSDGAGNVGKSTANTFTVDTVAPVVTLTAPVAGSFTNSSRPTFAGAAGIASGDLSTVKVAVYFGSSVSGTAVQMLSASASGGRWSIAATTALTGGTYTVQASQSDGAGNVGKSAAATFTLK